MRNANKTNGKHSRIEAKSFGRVEDNINAIPIMKDAGGKKCSLQPSPFPRYGNSICMPYSFI